MNDRARNWFKRNGALIALGLFAVLALLYLGDDIVNKREARVQLEPIPPTVESTDPIQGNPEGAVTVIEFGEFSCAACALQVDVLKDVINDYADEVAIIWKDAPLDSLKPESRLASVAAQCANRQNKFWEFHDALFEKQETLGRDTYLTIAEDVELNVENFTSCFDNRDTNAIVDRNIEAAKDARITATPTFFINGREYEGFMEYDELIQAFAQ